MVLKFVIDKKPSSDGVDYESLIAADYELSRLVSEAIANAPPGICEDQTLERIDFKEIPRQSFSRADLTSIQELARQGVIILPAYCCDQDSSQTLSEHFRVGRILTMHEIRSFETPEETCHSLTEAGLKIPRAVPVYFVREIPVVSSERHFLGMCFGQLVFVRHDTDRRLREYAFFIKYLYDNARKDLLDTALSPVLSARSFREICDLLAIDVKGQDELAQELYDPLIFHEVGHMVAFLNASLNGMRLGAFYHALGTVQERNFKFELEAILFQHGFCPNPGYSILFSLMEFAGAALDTRDKSGFIPDFVSLRMILDSILDKDPRGYKEIDVLGTLQADLTCVLRKGLMQQFQSAARKIFIDIQKNPNSVASTITEYLVKYRAFFDTIRLSRVTNCFLPR